MTSQQRLQQVLAHPAIWQARHTLTASGQMSCEPSGGSVASGYPQMDSALQGRGWPTGKLIECLYQRAGQHELHFFMPALAQLSRQSPPKYKTTRSDKKTPTENKDADHRLILLIAPPYLPCYTGWQQHGIDCKRLWVLQIKSVEQQLWAAEQALKSGCCAAVLLWPRQQQLPVSQLRKLQLAAQQSAGIFVFFRRDRYRQQSSCATLRIALSTKKYNKRVRLCAHILKQPGSWGGQCIDIPLHRKTLSGTNNIAMWPVHTPTWQHTAAFHIGNTDDEINGSDQITPSIRHS